MAKASLEAHTGSTNDAFGKFAASASAWLGSKWAFAGAGIIIVLWAAVGPIFHFSDTWQLVINTGTTIVTFLMVFLIQNTQNRDSVAIQLKLDELIRGVEGARTSLVDLESLDDEDILRLKQEFERIHRGAAMQDDEAALARLADTDSPATRM